MQRGNDKRNPATPPPAIQRRPRLGGGARRHRCSAGRTKPGRFPRPPPAPSVRTDPRPLTAAAAEALPQELAAGEVLEPEAAGDPLAYRPLPRAGGTQHHRPQHFGGHGRLPEPGVGSPRGGTARYAAAARSPGAGGARSCGRRRRRRSRRNGGQGPDGTRIPLTAERGGAAGRTVSLPPPRTRYTSARGEGRRDERSGGGRLSARLPAPSGRGTLGLVVPPPDGSRTDGRRGGAERGS